MYKCTINNEEYIIGQARIKDSRLHIQIKLPFSINRDYGLAYDLKLKLETETYYRIQNLKHNLFSLVNNSEAKYFRIYLKPLKENEVKIICENIDGAEPILLKAKSKYLYEKIVRLLKT